MGGLGEGLVGRLLVAVLVLERQIVGHVLMQDRRALGQRIACFDEDRQILVFDFDEFGGVLGDVLGLRDHDCNRFADEADAFMGETGAERNAQRAAADALEERRRRHALPAGGDEIGAGENIERLRPAARAFAVSIRTILACARSLRTKLAVASSSKRQSSV